MMTAFSGMAYAQTRIQSRYGQRADVNVWLKLHNIHDAGSYLQTAQQSPLRHWVLGISATQSSDDVELALRQKYRNHVDEVAGWMPFEWQKPVQWIKRLVDLPALQYLVAGGEPYDWMKSDPEIGACTADDPLLRMQALRQNGSGALVDAWREDGALLPGWLSQWNAMRPASVNTEKGMQSLEQLLRGLLQAQSMQGAALQADHEAIVDRLRLVFRRYAFQPAAVCAWLAIVAADLHRLRGDLMQRFYFQSVQDAAEDLPL